MQISIELLGLKDGKLTEFKFEGQTYHVTPQRPIAKPRLSKTEILGRDKTYGTDITFAESQLVRNAIMSTAKGYVPTTESIVKETGLPLNRVRATIHLLKSRGVVKSRIGKQMQPVHRLVTQ